MTTRNKSGVPWVARVFLLDGWGWTPIRGRKALGRADVMAAVKALRTQLGWTQQKLAVEMGWSLSTVANYESRRAPTEFSVLQELVGLATQADRGDLAATLSCWHVQENLRGSFELVSAMRLSAADEDMNQRISALVDEIVRETEAA